MQKQQKGVQWIVDAVESGRINPLHPDMTIIPDDILAEIGWEETPEGEVIPQQAAMDLGMFLFFHARMAEMIKRDQKLSTEVTADVNEVVSAVECFATLASLEQLRRAELLDYWPSSEGWAEASWGREITKLNKAVRRCLRSEMSN
jgi:hypothetical protein